MRYVATTSESFYYSEMKRTCEFLYKNGYKIEDIDLKSCLRENDILDSKSESNFSKKYQTLNKRIKGITETLTRKIVEEDIEVGKFINLYLILCIERFMAEFMDEVIRDKFINFDYYLTEVDFKNYLRHKEEQSEIVSNWSNYGKKKMLTKIKTFLVEGGFLKKEKDGSFKIVKPFIDEEIIEEIRNNGNKEILKVMLY